MKRLKSSKFLIPVLIVIIFILILYILVRQNTSKNIEEEKTTEFTEETEVVKETPKLIDESLYEEKSYTQPTQYTTFKISYPQFKNTSAGFNKKIEDLVTGGIDAQKKDSEESWKARYETRSPGDKITEFPSVEEKFYFNVSWKPIQVNDEFISSILTVSGYTGGAHGYENSTSFNYDVINRKEIALADLFPSDPNYLKTISTFSRKNLETQFRKSLNIKTKDDEANFKDSVIPMLTEGTMPTLDNFSVFTFTEDSITFYFAQYQVGPYTMGEPKVIMPRK